ncbi:hypothetical protein [Streptomyces sp. TLI_146]|nr:hypothetical protein [Streptomyces sp. TLI_146]
MYSDDLFEHGWSWPVHPVAGQTSVSYVPQPVPILTRPANGAAGLPVPR